jgi:hypothetical protein
MDAVAFDLLTPVVVSAGNRGPSAKTVGEPGSAYNVIAVGNVDDKGTVSRSDDTIASSSSRGPTGDGRTKPDISAPGTGIMSCNNKWETQSNFVAKSGTSMAAPHIAGSVLLILDYVGSKWDPRAIKALLLNTAEDKGGTGPDNNYGYGYVDLKHAFSHRGDVKTGSLADKPEGKVEKFYKGPAKKGDRATLVWSRHVTYNGSSFPTSYLKLSDLDLYMYDESNGASLADSTSRINNVEQVKSGSSYPSVVIKIEPFGSYPTGISSESYGLSTEESFSEVSPPTLSAGVSAPTSVASGDTFTASTTVTNTGSIKGHMVSATLNLPSGFTIQSGSNPQSLGSIDPGSGNSKTAIWTVRAPMVGSNTDYTLATSVSSSSYKDSYSASASKSVTVSPDSTMMDAAGVFRPSTGGWEFNYDNAGAAEYSFVWGASTDIPVAGDWDGDGDDEAEVFRPSTGGWEFNYDNAGGAEYSFVWGARNDIPVAGDWDGDGVDEAGFFRPSIGDGNSTTTTQVKPSTASSGVQAPTYQ